MNPSGVNQFQLLTSPIQKTLFHKRSCTFLNQLGAISRQFGNHWLFVVQKFKWTERKNEWLYLVARLPKQSEYLWDSSRLWSCATRPKLIGLRTGIQLNKTILRRVTNEPTSSFRYHPKLCEMFSHSFSERELSFESPYLYTVGNSVCLRNTDILETGQIQPLVERWYRNEVSIVCEKT